MSEAPGSWRQASGLLLLGLAAACASAQKSGNAHDRLGPMLAEVIRFQTVAGNEEARKAQQQWLMSAAAELGLVARDAGPVTEIELPGPAGAPVLGLIVHGDVQPVDDKQWTLPPFAGVIQGGQVLGRGAADDKGPLVQALLAMREIRDEPRTMTVRLLVGSDEESGSSDMKAYLAGHKPPDYSLVLDSEFPVVVGEKAWDGLAVFPSSDKQASDKPWNIASVDAGLGASIVPDLAKLTLHWREGEPKWAPLEQRLQAKPFDEGTSLELVKRGADLEVVVHGHAAHAGVSLSSGRNALVSMAHLLSGELPDCALTDLISFAGSVDQRGAFFGLTDKVAPGWGGYAVNVATLRVEKRMGDKLALVINLRRPPPLTAPQAREWDFAHVKAFSNRLVPQELFFGDEPLVFDVNAKIVKRLMADYAKATGENPPPAISGGGTYAKRVPHAIAFGMWFPGKPYPGHSADEQISV
ncbi:MAG TPA: M20/M25/M40 family metallo-hydrolase, partial [Myxococcales bacterium]|nr:M20/M25/M40 family metallo-hydrolase [Myxococcales bacterium]